MRKRKLKRHIGRNLLIGGILAFCISIGVYVSIPDYPKNAYAWEIMLWGEKSQWWSEITWIILFGLFSILCVLLITWNKDMRASSAFQRYFRLTFSIIFALASFDYSILYYQHGSLFEVLILDRGGWLHGMFYLWTAMLGGLAFEELMAYFAKAHNVLRHLTLPPQNQVRNHSGQSPRQVHQEQGASSTYSPEQYTVDH